MGVYPSSSVVDEYLSPSTSIGSSCLLIGCGSISITCRDETVVPPECGGAAGLWKWLWGYEGTAGWTVS